MLRYFIAANLWLAAALAILLGRGTSRRGSDYYSLFGSGSIPVAIYWIVVLAALATAFTCAKQLTDDDNKSN